MNDSRYLAILLLGPTGVGKTPLGQMFEQQGWHGRRCVHFDFGENLRAAVRNELPSQSVSLQDIQFLRGVLEQGVLLEDTDFPLAERILRVFLSQRRADFGTYVVLNGLPRHSGQASALEELVAVRTVVCLECTAETVVQRIREDPGGDRAGRDDDQLSAVARKLEIYQQRTTPLVDWYRQRGARILPVPVSAWMTAADIWAAVQLRRTTDDAPRVKSPEAGKALPW
jgi:adenylate kinase